MSSPEFRINAKITVNETNINWKTARNTAKGHISLLDANDNVIQTFPFDVELRDAAALAKFAELISQEQIVRTLSETAQNNNDDGDDAIDSKAAGMVSSIRAKQAAAISSMQKSKIGKAWKDVDDSGG